MTDQPKQENTDMRLAIDNKRLDAAIERTDAQMDVKRGQILTASQMRLEYDSARKPQLQSIIAEQGSQNASLRKQIESLKALLDKGESAVKDAQIELKGVLMSINAMELEGITLPLPVQE
jgi:seryl-tRNA synthetase